MPDLVNQPSLFTTTPRLLRLERITTTTRPQAATQGTPLSGFEFERMVISQDPHQVQVQQPYLLRCIPYEALHRRAGRLLGIL